MENPRDPATPPQKSGASSLLRASKDAQPEIISQSLVRKSPQAFEWDTNEQRRELIAIAAYFLAEERRFEPGHEVEDWLAAEAQIGAEKPTER